MKIVNKFIYKIFFVAVAVCLPGLCVKAQDSKPLPETGNAASAQTKTTDSTEKKVKPNPEQNSESPASSAENTNETSKKNKSASNSSTTQAKTQKTKPSKIPPANTKAKEEPTAQPDAGLPEVSESEISQKSGFEPPASESKTTKSILHIAISLLLVASGIVIVAKAIFKSFKIPPGYEPSIKSKHYSKHSRRNNKYKF